MIVKWVFMCFLLFLYDMYLILNTRTQIKFKSSVFTLGNESQIPQIEYSKPQIVLPLLLLPSAKNNI